MASSPLRSGFTLIELLLVLGIIGMLSSIVIAALSPARQLATGRDAKRQSDVNTILNAVYQYTIDNHGNLPLGIPTGTALQICRSGASSCVNGVDLNVLSGAYLVTIPVDPQLDPLVGTGTNYFIRKNADGRLTVSAPGAEEDEDVSVTR